MKTIHFYLSLFLIFNSGILAFGQELDPSKRFCPPPPSEQITELNQAIQKARQAKILSGSSEKIYKIPVVIHIIHNTKSGTIGGPTNKNITDEQILSQIKILNEDYRRKNSDTTNTPSYFKPVAVDTKIEFCLAQLDPQGNPTTGITRDYSEKLEFDYVSDDATLKKINYWPSDKYLNIWVCKIALYKGDPILGYSTFPSLLGTGLKGESMNTPLTDGVVIDYRFLGNTGTATIKGFNGGRTAVHEIGHYLGLLHTFDDSNNACFTDNDYCNDTPIQDNSTQGSELTSGCSTELMACKSKRMFQNYLDYTPDDCLNMFTADQKFRMRTVLELSTNRKSLLSSYGCCVENKQFVTIPYYENFENEVKKWESSLGKNKFDWKWNDTKGNFNALSSTENLLDTAYLSSPYFRFDQLTNEKPIVEYKYAYSTSLVEKPVLNIEYDLGCADNWYPLSEITENKNSNTSKPTPFEPTQENIFSEKLYLKETINQQINIIRFRFKANSHPDHQVFLTDFNLYPNNKNFESTVFPIPVNTKLNMSIIVDELQNIIAQIYSTSGKLVFNESFTTLSDTKTIDVSLLSAGMYFLHIKAQGQTKIHKIVKY